MKYGFINVAAAVPAVKVADTRYNVEETLRMVVEADAQGVEIICFPELGLTGYSCQDLFTQQLLVEEAEQS
ncbi:MAG: NAD(+) synthase, partial [Prevotella sp.]|nr:NAD(+) synthase [Prevotella sp.]